MDPLDRLVEAGLFGDSLVSIHTPQLVNRYNDGLARLGLVTTPLTEFSIDGIGWSPQIAARREDDDYLLAGPANPMGIIVTPDQRGRPVYRPYTSYDRRMIDAFFEAHYRAISDITAETAIGLDFDQELTTYETAQDLEMVREVTVRSETNGLSKAAGEQLRLVDELIKDDQAWSDKAKREKLIANSRSHGDLRRRNFHVPEFVFKVRNFHTRAFGGVFVLRHRRGTILVLENQAETGLELGKGIYDLNDPELPDVLLAEKFIELDLDWYRKHPDVLNAKKGGMAVDAILAIDPNIDLTSLTELQWKRLSAKAANKLPAAYGELERLEGRLRQGKTPSLERLSKELKLLLYRPRRGMPDSEQVPIWQLLIRLEPLDVYRLYTSDKNLFFRLYKTWPEAEQAWAVELLRQTYLPEKKHHKTRRQKND